VTVSLLMPRRVNTGEWQCPFRITGLRVPNIQEYYGHGEDSMQALTLALQGIRVMLEQNRQRVSWLGGEPGDHGFARMVPEPFGLKFSTRLNRIIDRGIARELKRLEVRYRKRMSMLKHGGRCRDLT
jgi:hypothetical protein